MPINKYSLLEGSIRNTFLADRSPAWHMNAALGPCQHQSGATSTAATYTELDRTTEGCRSRDRCVAGSTELRAECYAVCTAGQPQHAKGNPLPSNASKLCLINDQRLNGSGTQDLTAVLGYPNLSFYSALVYQVCSSHLKRKVLHAAELHLPLRFYVITGFFLSSALLSC